MKRLLDLLGSPFVYRSPEPFQGFISFLYTLPNSKLRVLAETTSHHSKKQLIALYLKNVAKKKEKVA